MRTSRRVIAAVVAAAWVLWSGNPALAQLAQQIVTVMSYNVENLFDTENDPDNPQDITYLPRAVKQANPDHDAECDALNERGTFYNRECRLLDWSEEVLSVKLANLAKVIAAYDGGRGPDILSLQEVENRFVVEMLRDEIRRLTGNDLAYPTLVHVESSDWRGIDVALLSKFPVAATEPVAHVVSSDRPGYEECGDTRDILEAHLLLPDDTILAVFGVHLPSLGNDEVCRLGAADTLNRVASGQLAIALGDFNTGCKLVEREPMLDALWRGNWLIPRVVLTRETYPRSSATTEASIDRQNCWTPGSQFYAGTWSWLDLILGSTNLNAESNNPSPWMLDLGSFSTHVGFADQFVRSGRYQIPRRFNAARLQGYSDHLPVVARLIWRGPNP